MVSESFEVVLCGGAGAFEVIDFAIDFVKLDFPLLGLLAVFVPTVDCCCFSPADCFSEVGVRKRPIPELIRLLFDFVSNLDSFPILVDLFPSPFGGFIDEGCCNLELVELLEGIVSSTAVLEVVDGRSRTSFDERSEARDPLDDAESDLPGRSPFLFGTAPL